MARRTTLVAALPFFLFACAEASNDDVQGGSDAGGGGEASTGGSNEGGANEGGTGGSPPIDLHCEPEDGELVDPACGIFVDPSASAGGDGSQADPFRSITDAIEKAGTNEATIYVCTGAVDESVTLPPAVDLHGGLLCTANEWRWYLDVRTEWTSDPGTIPLTVTGAVSEEAATRVTGFDITASDVTIVSQSSIAALVDGGYVSFERVSLVSGDAANGQPTMPGQTPNGSIGGAGGNGSGSFDEGLGGTSVCGSTGGDGGQHVGVVSSAGKEGLPDQNNGGTTDGSVCMNGGPGAIGAQGADGVSGSFGTIDALGFHPADGTPGQDGIPGGGGGGGGAVFNKAGGGGGGGGCGGTGGVAGTGGGSSFALVMIGASVSFVDVSLATGNAGDGGHGWAGGLGGAGGPGGQGVDTACDGGVGAQGGDGGRGGDGGGGHAAAIAYVGAEPSLEGASVTEPAPSQAGSGQGDASDGQAVLTLAFDTGP